MSFPQFTVTGKLAESSSTILSVIRLVNNLLTNLQNIFQSLLNKVQLDSLILTNVQLKTGATTISHTLGRTLTGWQIIRQRAQANIWDDQDNNPSPTIYLRLMASAPVVVDILVF